MAAEKAKRILDARVPPCGAGLDRRQFCHLLPTGIWMTLGLPGCFAPARLDSTGPLGDDAGLHGPDGSSDLSVALDGSAPADGAGHPAGDDAATPDLSSNPPPGDAGGAEDSGGAESPDHSPTIDAGPDACPPRVFVTGLSPRSVPVDSATFVRAASAFVCRDAGGLFAVSSVCTHLGFDLDAVNGGAGGFHCGWHGSRFALDGRVTQGPAGQPLEHYRLCLDGGGHIGIDVNHVVVAGKRYDL